MISAAEALELSNKAKTRVEYDTFLTKTIEPAIKKEADLGRKEVFIKTDTILSYASFELPSDGIERYAYDILNELGYKVTYTTQGPKYVPRGMSDDYGNGQEYIDIGLRVTWYGK